MVQTYFLSQIAKPFSKWKCSLNVVFDDLQLPPTTKNRGQCHAPVISQGLQTFWVHILAIHFSWRKRPWERTSECCMHCHLLSAWTPCCLQCLLASMSSLLPQTSDRSSAKFGEHNKSCTPWFVSCLCMQKHLVRNTTFQNRLAIWHTMLPAGKPPSANMNTMDLSLDM